VSWDDALDFIVKRMRAVGPEAVGLWAGHGGFTPGGAVWIRDGWVGLNHLTSGHAILTGDALNLFPFSVGQADYGAKVEVTRN
jgi:hypothetical protein